ncbi:Ribulose bisphosphate carboxylase small chain, chloroplastic [Sesamum angolense]|uniref:Ribulose bisphosphate carboxylase small subunit, chloroplastic n=1 Tax=Sesamum angolense TaxID=2727404 RepID=A0AAE1WIB1_9LAMI|nr:Ribulose bisphosphate carboxylase small chain, chloroplastic [Sesamum angolense]
MASSVISSTAAVVARASPAQASMVAPFTGLKSAAGFPVTRKSNDITSLARNVGRVQCIQVWPTQGKKKFETLSYLPELTTEQLAKEIDYLIRSNWIPCIEFELEVWPTQGKKKFETLSYLPELTTEQLAKEIDYLIRSNWIPCIEFELEHGFVYREHNRSPGYYDGRYWTMWKLPMYGCTDSSQVLVELNEAIKAHPDGFIRIIGFDNVRQVQCISFIAYKPPGY